MSPPGRALAELVGDLLRLRRGPLGQWLELGGEVTTSGESERGVLAFTARTGRSARRIAIKVDLAP